MRKSKKKKNPILPPVVAELRGTSSYAKFLTEIKSRVAETQTRATLLANRELLTLYWSIGRSIVEKQQKEKWSSSVIERLASDLKRSFPAIEGFSERNIWRMRAFYLAYPAKTSRSNDGKLKSRFLPPTVAEIPWTHQIILIEKVKSLKERKFYAGMALEYGWSKAILATQIDSRLISRQGNAITNFKRALPPPHSDMAQQSLKDPYIFDFLTLAPEAQEHDLEQGLIEHVQKFLLELGVGFAFVGRQVPLKVGKREFYIDLLFYHLSLRCFVIIELKAGSFEPEFAGKLNFYLSAVDDKYKRKEDRPSIGLLLCKSKNKIEVEYALRDVHKPIGVAAWKVVEALPRELKSSLPTVKQIEHELRKGKKKAN